MNPWRSCILTYHSLDSSGSVISMNPALFRAQMSWLAETRTPVVELSEVQRIPGSVALTFDDGFSNFFDHALPVLQKYGFPATVFVVGGYCGGRNNWPSQPAHPPLPLLDLMGWTQIEKLAKAGVRVGSHTVNHPRLNELCSDDVESELSASRSLLEHRIGKPVSAFSYPYGSCSPSVQSAVERHYTLACGVNLDFVSQGSDPFLLPRIDTYYLRNLGWFRKLGTTQFANYIAVRRALRTIRRAAVSA
jgi:peptidoglycan/xylan/chitin deacetylase (PgdA/CDA1 family)